ncbi:MAG: hypothetical protein ACREQZ_04750, partial [Woeseiaceae bacterium]
MASLRKLLVLLIIAPAWAIAGLAAADLPEGTVWYFHADLGELRKSKAGRELYRWLDGEVFVEIHEEIGIDINKEADRVTAFSDGPRGAVIVVEGNISEDSRNKLMALAAAEAGLEAKSHKGKTYYHVHDSNGMRRGKGSTVAAHEPFEDDAYFTFGVPGKLIVTSSAERMEAMLDSGGKIAGSGSHEGALFVLTADKAFVQAGLDTNGLADDDGDWESNILRNTEQAAVLVADRDDMIAVEAQLVSSDPHMAESIGSIVNGLISLQALNSELDPQLRSLIQNT